MAIGGLIWLSMGNAFRAVLKVSVIAVLARLLAPDAFGLLAAAGVVLWLSHILSNIGIGSALVQRRDNAPGHLSTAFVVSMAVGCAFGIGAYASSPWVAGLFRMPGLEPVLRTLAPAFPIGALGLVASCLLQRQLRFDTIAAVELAAYAVGYGIVGITLAWLGYGVWSLVFAELAKTSFKTAAFLAKVPFPGVRFSLQCFRELFRFGSGYTASGLAGYVATQADSVVVGRLFGAEALGLYGRAQELMLVPAKALGELLHKVLFPALSRVQHERENLLAAYRRGAILVALTVLPTSAVSLVLAEQIVAVLLGPNWSATVFPLQVFCAAMYFRIGYMVAESVAVATGAVYRAAWRAAVYAGLVAGGALAGAAWGLPGVAAGVTIAIAVHFAMMSRLAGRLVGIEPLRFVALHVPALLLAFSCAIAAAAASDAVETISVEALGSLAAGLAAALCTAFLLLRAAPARLLGPDGIWLVTALLDNSPHWLRRPLHWALPLPAGTAGERR